MGLFKDTMKKEANTLLKWPAWLIGVITEALDENKRKVISDTSRLKNSSYGPGGRLAIFG